jgi:hypothetical protein
VAGDRNQITAFKLRDANEDGAVTMEEAIVFGRRGGGSGDLNASSRQEP